MSEKEKEEFSDSAWKKDGHKTKIWSLLKLNFGNCLTKIAPLAKDTPVYSSSK